MNCFQIVNFESFLNNQSRNDKIAYNNLIFYIQIVIYTILCINK